jgi:hypothetical protein
VTVKNGCEASASSAPVSGGSGAKVGRHLQEALQGELVAG